MDLGKEKVVEFRIKRFDPEKHNKKPHISTYKVPILSGMSILDALLYIKDNLDGTLAFRHSCRMGVCGSCGIQVMKTDVGMLHASASTRSQYHRD